MWTLTDGILISARNGVDKFNDLPSSHRSNVDTTTPPFGRTRGARRVWSDAEIEDVVEFLNTLTDGYRK